MISSPLPMTHLYRHFARDGSLLYVGVSLRGVARNESMTARKPRGRVGGWRFRCTGCGCEVYQPERDSFDDWICANCRFGKPGSRAVTKSQRPEPAEGWLALSKSQRLEFILAKLGTGDIDLDQYHAMMVEQQLTEDDVDDWCREYRACVDSGSDNPQDDINEADTSQHQKSTSRETRR